MKIFMSIIICVFILTSCNSNSTSFNRVLLQDDFSKLDTGLFSIPLGARAEYHYLPEVGIKGNWVVSSYRSAGGLRAMGWSIAWQVGEDDTGKTMNQTYFNNSYPSSHPMIITGDSLWQDYKLTVVFRPENDSLSSGVAFRYRNDRQFYFFGIENGAAYISKIDHGSGFRQLEEKVLAEQPFTLPQDQDLIAEVTVKGSIIEAKLNEDIFLQVTDEYYPNGKIGLVSNTQAQYKSVEVLTSEKEFERINRKRDLLEQELARLQETNPSMVLWKKISTKGFGVGRNLRFGDLNMDGEKDVLIGQVFHHNWPRDSHTELSCLTAMTFDGEILWQVGEPNPDNDHLTNDVAFQIHDIDNDGNNEVIYTMNFELIIADGSTGKIKKKVQTPMSKVEGDMFPQILGDCLFFFDCEGKGYDSNILIKDRYWNFWVMNSNLDVIWEGNCKTGHYPYAYDINDDEKDELAIGYSLYDDDGTLLWSLDDKIEDHCDGVAIVDFDQNPLTKPEILYAASDAGHLRVDLDGNILKEHFVGHVQNPAVANFRPDIPGLETVTINFWGNQGIMHFFDSNGDIYYDFEPNQFGSMCLPLNWTGSEEEYFVHNPNISEGGVFDGWGRKVLEFPNDGHPDMCNAVLDITGDCRDEIIVWNPNEIWVYTQSDNPKQGRLYKPVRNPLYNSSNYQATVSLPGWNED